MVPAAFKTAYLFLALVALPQVLAGTSCSPGSYGRPSGIKKCKTHGGYPTGYSKPPAVTPSTPTPTPTPTPTTSPSPTPTDPSTKPINIVTDKIKDEALSAHNNYRAKYNAPALTWDSSLATFAADWGSKCFWGHSGGPNGENLAAGTGAFTVTNAVDMWMSEAKDYDPKNPIYSHFTQVVWKGSTAVGCAIVTCPDGTVEQAGWGNALYIICEYSPPGNVEGEFGDNVEVP